MMSTKHGKLHILRCEWRYNFLSGVTEGFIVRLFDIKSLYPFTMKKIILAFLTAISMHASAQEMPYTLTILNEEYAALSEAISAVDDQTWDDPNTTVPIGFTFQFIDEVITDLALIAPGSQILSMVIQDSVHFLEPYLADIIDVGYDTASLSPIRFATEGSPGSRIFKMEWANVGFYNEWEALNTTTNRTNFQMWLYEGSNIIEFRFGDNTITNPSEVHFAGGPIIGLGTNAPNTGGWENFWMLTGDPLSPTIFNYQDQKSFPPVMDSEPPTGTIYRFAPTFVSVEENKQEAGLSVYPTLAIDQLNVIWKNDITTASVFNTIGELVMTLNLQRGLQQIDISALSAGQYFLSIAKDDQVIHQPFMKQ